MIVVTGATGHVGANVIHMLLERGERVRAVIGKILAHLGLPTRAPPRAPARLDTFLQTA
jgi:nucleoside-diphosphate-sugar epimerase